MSSPFDVEALSIASVLHDVGLVASFSGRDGAAQAKSAMALRNGDRSVGGDEEPGALNRLEARVRIRCGQPHIDTSAADPQPYLDPPVLALARYAHGF